MSLGQFNENHAIQTTQFFFVSDGTSQKGVSSQQSFDTRYDQCLCMNAGLIDHVVNIGFQLGPPNINIISVNVPAGAGLGGVPPVDLLLNFGTTLQPGLVVPSGSQLAVNLEVAVVADNDVLMTFLGGTL